MNTVSGLAVMNTVAAPALDINKVATPALDMNKVAAPALDMNTVAAVFLLTLTLKWWSFDVKFNFQSFLIIVYIRKSF